MFQWLFVFMRIILCLWKKTYYFKSLLIFIFFALDFLCLSEEIKASLYQGVIISEFMVNPKAVSDNNGEWIELVNLNKEAVNLKNWVLKSTNSEETFKDDFIIDGLSVAVICKNSNVDENGGIICDYEYSSVSLINDGGFIGLKDSLENFLRVNYSKEQILNGKSLDFIFSFSEINTIHCLFNGEEDFILNNPIFFNNFTSSYNVASNWEFGSHCLDNGDYGTPGESFWLEDWVLYCLKDEGENLENSSTVSENEEVGDDNEDNREVEDKNGIDPTDDYSIFISEVLSNPEGVDGYENEFIELYNPNDFSVNLKNWEIQNSRNQKYKFLNDQNIRGKSLLVILREEFRFNLYNQDEKIILFNDKVRPIDEVFLFGTASSGKSFNRDFVNNDFFWSDIITMGQENLREEIKNDDNLLAVENEVEMDTANNTNNLFLDNSLLNNKIQNINQNNGLEKEYYVVDKFSDLSELMIGKRVQMEADYLKRVFFTLYFIKDNQEFKVYVPESLRESLPSLNKGSFYQIKGILEKTKTGLRILAEDISMIKKAITEKEKIDVAEKTLVLEIKDHFDSKLKEGDLKNEELLREKNSIQQVKNDWTHYLLKTPIPTKGNLLLLDLRKKDDKIIDNFWTQLAKIILKLF